MAIHTKKSNSTTEATYSFPDDRGTGLDSKSTGQIDLLASAVKRVSIQSNGVTIQGGTSSTPGWVRIESGVTGNTGQNGALRNIGVSTINSDSGVTLTAAQLRSGVIERSGASAPVTDILPSAANIIALIPNAKVGDSFEFLLYNGNTSSGAITLSPGAGVTIRGSTSINISTVARLLVRVTGTNTVTVYRA